MAVKKLAVLGGGMGSLTAVYQLTSDPEWTSKYEITIYHMGWRLGGKGASGRNGAVINNMTSQRIEEHGLHLWFGFYDNAFNLIQQCYKDNNRAPGTPLATWQEAFSGYDAICMQENVDGKWDSWLFEIPPNELTPGNGGKRYTIKENIYRLLELIKSLHQSYQQKKSPQVQANIQAHTQTEHMSLIRKLVSGIVTEGEDLFADAGDWLLHAALKVAQVFDEGILKEVLLKLKEWIVIIAQDLAKTDADLRRIFIEIDLAVVTIKGMISDNVTDKGFDVINDIDFRDWLQKHGALEVTINSALVQGVYGLVFGGNRQYTFEAGTALRGLFRLGLTYKGHVYYRMMAGMGDVIFGPMYQVLQKRGVNFQFFNKVTNLGLNAGKTSIATISIDVQATIKTGSNTYNPLIVVNGLPSWPCTPDYSQLNEGNALQSQNINLESYYSTWKPVSQKILNAGTDFDEVILGISIGALPTITKEFTDADWQAMLQNVIPVSTVAYQLWMSCSIEQMQYPFADKGLPLLGSYHEPYDTWADMSDLINREAWPAGYVPQNIAYFCGPMPQPYANEILQNAQTGNFNNPDFPAQQTQVAKNYAADYLQNLTAHIWPGIWPQGQTQFDYTKLIDLNNGTGSARFDAQFFRANIDPTELYVMSFTNSSKYRLRTDKTAYSNLFITGDWIDNGFNAGCIEATVMSGLQAARAVSGQYIEIPGEKDI
jgi:uncharacterized protein with NAD-binding domain and iron-sulfur cluster